MVFDIENHEKNKIKYLKALYSIAQEHISTHKDVGDPTRIFESFQAIAERAQLTRLEADRIYSELRRYDLIKSAGVLSETTPQISLTQEGLELIETHLYEQSLLGKRRMLKSWGVEKLKELAQIGAGKMLAGLGGFLLAALAIQKADFVPWLIKHILGK